MTIIRKSPQEKAGSAGRGFTLIEMLVAVALFTMLIIIFGWVLVQAQRLVKKTTAVMRANTAINTIERVIRQDLGNLIQSGVLYIGNRSISGTTYPILIFTRAGTLGSATMVNGQNPDYVYMNQANAAICAYSILPVTGSLSGEKIIFRASWLLNKSPTVEGAAYTGVGPSLDSYTQYAGDISSSTAAAMLASGGALYDLLNSSNYIPTDLPNPIQTLSQMDSVWKYLATGGADLDIEWTDGSLNVSGGNELQWKSLATAGLTSILWCKGANMDSTGVHRFPAAIRVSFSLTGDEVRALGESGMTFKIIISLPRKGK